MQHGTARPHGNHRQRIGHVFGGQRRALKRVKRDIDARAGAGANLFTDIKHRCFVAFAFADHHNAGNIKFVQLGPHCIHGGLICGLFIAASDQRGAGDGSRL